MSLYYENRRWVIEYQIPNILVKGILKENKTEKDVLEEIEKYLNENPNAKLVEYYYGYYDPEEDDYVKQ